MVSFEKDIGILIRTMGDCRFIDYDKLMSELRIIAHEAKKRGYSTKQYLTIIERYAESAILGKHVEMKFNINELTLN